MTETSMMHEDDHDDIGQEFICFHCVGDSYLQEEIQRNGQRGRCSYCERVDSIYSTEILAERVEQAFEQHFVRTADQPNSWQTRLLSDRESDYDWDRDGEPVVWAIANAAGVNEGIAQDIQSILHEKHGDYDTEVIGEETDFHSDSYYEERRASDETWQAAWSKFERSLKTEARFFNRVAADHLASLFSAIGSMSTIDNRPLVVDAGPGTSIAHLYRARVFQSNNALVAALCRPDRHLGPPPSRLVGAGRMNASGISVFYGASHPRTAVSEVRPPIGSQVAVAQFDIMRPTRLLDLTALGAAREVGSIFDPDFVARTERAAFLRGLSARMSQPVMPDDETFDYLPTQAVADFLATESTLQLDGILFPSAQAGNYGLNIVLFHKASRVEAIEIPEGAEVTADTAQMYEGGWEREYTVIERISSKSNAADTAGDTGNRHRLQFEEHESERNQSALRRALTLRLNVNSIKVHVVNGVSYDTTEHTVTRYRWENGYSPY